MSNYNHQNIDPKANNLPEPSLGYGFKHISEEGKLRNDVFRSNKEKLQLFTKCFVGITYSKKLFPIQVFNV